MDIIYLGLSAFRLKGKTATVVSDPFDPQTVGLKFPVVEADIVTVSHAHKDHNYLQGVKNYVQVITGPGEYEIKGVSILGFPSYHDSKSGVERGKNIIFVYEMDGLRLAHLGDLGHQLSDSMIEDLGDIDVLMLPVGGEYTVGPAAAAEIVQNIEPAIVIPMHFNSEDVNQTTFGKLDKVDPFLKEVGLTVEKLPKLTLKKEDLGENQKVVLLDRK